MHATSRSIVAAARTHPAGIAAPSAVIVTAIVLFTLVTSVIVPAMPPGTGPVPGVSPYLPPGPAGGCPACDAGQVPGSAVVTVVTGAGTALHAATKTLTSGSVVPAVKVATNVAAAPVKVAVSAAAGQAVQGRSSEGGSSPAAARSDVTAAAQKAPVDAASVGVQVPVNATRSVESSVEQALPGAGSLPGVG